MSRRRKTTKPASDTDLGKTAFPNIAKKAPPGAALGRPGFLPKEIASEDTRTYKRKHYDDGEELRQVIQDAVTEPRLSNFRRDSEATYGRRLKAMDEIKAKRERVKAYRETLRVKFLIPFENVLKRRKIADKREAKEIRKLIKELNGIPPGDASWIRGQYRIDMVIDLLGKFRAVYE